MRYKIKGNWEKGLAFDLHILASTYLGPNEYGHAQYDNTRSEIGELIYQLKYRNDLSAALKIVELLKALSGIEKFDAIIPVPSSKKNRPYQPVDEIAKALGAQRRVEVLVGFLDNKTGGAELKNVVDPAKKTALLEGAITIADDRDISGKRILLLDDLYDSGATLNACCSVLRKNTKIGEIYVLTMTKTRS